VESKLGPLGTSATYWPIVPAPGDCEDGEFDGMNGRGNRSSRRKPAPAPLCPPQIPLDQTRDWTRDASVGSQRLTASAMARPYSSVSWGNMLQDGRSRVRFLTKSVDFLIGLILPAALWPSGQSTQPVTEISTRNLPRGKGRPAGA
jgi:hypothetical protein